MAKALGQDVSLALFDLDNEAAAEVQYDLVILATGHNRTNHQRLLSSLASHLGDGEVDRHYRVLSKPDFHPRVFLQGACESSHGLSDTLLSVTALRTMEIAAALDLTPRTAPRRIREADAALHAN